MNWQDYVLAFLPAGLSILAMRLIGRDANTAGADDATGQLLLQMQPLIPSLIVGGTINDNAADKIFLAIYRTAETYLKQRDKLPPQV